MHVSRLLQFYRHVGAASVMDGDYRPRLKLFFHELLFNLRGEIEGSDVVDVLLVLYGNSLEPHNHHIAHKFISFGFMSRKDWVGQG